MAELPRVGGQESVHNGRGPRRGGEGGRKTYISERWVLAEDPRSPEHNERQLGHLRAPKTDNALAGVEGRDIPIQITEDNQLACIRNRYSRTFLVTTSITSSCTAALNRNVMNAAENFDNRYVEMVVAYTCRSRNV